MDGMQSFVAYKLSSFPCVIMTLERHKERKVGKRGLKVQRDGLLNNEAKEDQDLAV